MSKENKNTTDLEDGPDYKPSIEYAKAKLLVRKAIAKGYCEYGAIHKFLKLPPTEDVQPLLDQLCVEHAIRRCETSFVAYFLYEQNPLRFWRIGSGKVEAEFMKGFTPRDEEKKAEELWNGKFVKGPKKNGTKPAVVEEIEDEEDDDDFVDAAAYLSVPATVENGNAKVAAFAVPTTQKLRSKDHLPDKPKPATPTADQVFRAAKETGTVTACAEQLGMTRSVFEKWLTEDKRIGRAFKSGSAEHRGSIAMRKHPGRTKSTARKAAPKEPAARVESIEPEISAEGQETPGRVRLNMFAESVSDPIPFGCREGSVEFKGQPPIECATDRIQIDGAGSIMIGSDVNILALSPEQRTYFFSFLELWDEFKKNIQPDNQ